MDTAADARAAGGAAPGTASDPHAAAHAASDGTSAPDCARCEVMRRSRDKLRANLATLKEKLIDTSKLVNLYTRTEAGTMVIDSVYV